MSTLSNRERMQLAISRREPDRVPVIPSTRIFSPQYLGIKYSECVKNPSKYVEAEMKCFNDFEYDAIWGMLGNSALAEALGAQIVIFEDDVPAVSQPLIINHDLKPLKVAKDVTCHPAVELICENIIELRQNVGKDTMIIAGGPAALSRTAGILCGLENFYIDVAMNPNFILELQEALFKPTLDFCLALIQAGADIIFFGNSIANSSCISREHYLSLVNPVNKKFFQSLKNKWPSGYIMYHTCGNWNDRFDLVVEEKPDIIHLSVEADLAEIKERWGKEVCLMGNVFSVKTMLQGSPEDVESEAVACINKAWKGGGFILSNDCSLPSRTPPQNVEKLVQTAKRFIY